MMNPAFLFFKSYQNVSEYVQEIPQSNTADQPTYPQNILSKGSWLGKEILLWSFEQNENHIKLNFNNLADMRKTSSNSFNHLAIKHFYL